MSFACVPLKSVAYVSHKRHTVSLPLDVVQVKVEVLDCLDFMKSVYGTFGMTYRLELSTRPEKALGDQALWDVAESVRTPLTCTYRWIARVQ
jgi:threonyl-tRNA synthetase